MGSSDQPDDARSSMPAPPLNIVEPLVASAAPDVDEGGKPIRPTTPGPGPGVPEPDANESASMPGPSSTPSSASQPGVAQRPSTEPLQDPPELIRKRYLRAGNQYFMKDEQHRLAFEDRGARLVTEHSRTDIAESMAEMASAKGWTSVRVSGQDEFRREVWLHASLRGLEVTGYTPQPVDRARLDALREDRLTNRIDVGIPAGSRSGSGAGAGAGAEVRTEVGTGVRADPGTDGTRPRETGPAPSPGNASRMPAHDAATVSTQAGHEGAATRLSGELLAHGSAPYRNSAKNSPSYFVTYRDAVGPHTIWGIDLGRAIPAAGAQIGDVVALENLGKRWVTVNVPVLNDAGEMTGVRPKEVYRNTWEVQLRERRRDEPSDVVRSDVARAAQRAAGESLDPVERAREAFFDQSPLWRPSQPLTETDQMKHVHVAVIGEVMRSQGFGVQAIERVQAHCARLVNELQEQGVTVPAPRRYDRNAAPTRMRHASSPATASQTKEIERAVNHPDPSMPSL